MKIKLILSMLLLLGSCSSRKPIDNFYLNYKNDNVSVKVTITHKAKIDNLHTYKNPYFYYGEMELEILKPNIKESDIPYLVTIYENQKSDFEYDSLADYGNFWGHLDWHPNSINKYKIYFTFDGKNIDTSKISIKEIDKKFRYLPLDFYDH